MVGYAFFFLTTDVVSYSSFVRSIRLRGSTIGRGHGWAADGQFWNLFMVQAIARLLLTKDTVGIFNIHQLMQADGGPVKYPSEGYGTHTD